MYSNLIFCVDFDGTVVTHDFPRIGEPVPGALECLRYLQTHGGKIILYTMRSDGQRHGNVLTEAVEYLSASGIELYGVNRNPQQRHWTASPKVYGHYYIDDAALGCPLVQPAIGRPYVDWRAIWKLLPSGAPGDDAETCVHCHYARRYKGNTVNRCLFCGKPIEVKE